MTDPSHEVMDRDSAHQRCAVTIGIEDRGRGRVKAFFELLGKAMQSTGMTLRLCLLMLVAAAAYAISQLK